MQPSSESYDATLLLNLKHFVSATEECVDRAQYDAFFSFVCSDKPKLLQFCCSAVADETSELRDTATPQNGYSMIKTAIENVLVDRDVQRVTYMKRFVMQLNALVLALFCAEQGQEHSQIAAEIASNANNFIDLLMDYASGQHIRDDMPSTGVEHILQTAALSSLATIFDALSNAHQSIVSNTLNRIMLARREMDSKDAFVELIFRRIVQQCNNGYVRAAACELLASYCSYCNLQNLGITTIVGECMTQCLDSHRFELLDFLAGCYTILQSLPQSSRTQSLATLLNEIQVVNKYILSLDSLTQILNNRAVADKLCEVIVLLSKQNDATLQTTFALLVSNLLDNAVTVPMALDLLACCSQDVIRSAFEAQAASHTLVSRLRVLLASTTTSVQENTSNPKRAKLAVSVLEALVRIVPLFLCRPSAASVEASWSQLVNELCTTTLDCIKQFEWVHGNTTNRKLCLCCLDLLGKMASLLLLLSSASVKQRLLSELTEMSSHQSSINHSIIYLEASKLLARLLVRESTAADAEGSTFVSRFWLSIQASFFDMNWEIRDSVLQLICYLCSESWETGQQGSLSFLERLLRLECQNRQEEMTNRLKQLTSNIMQTLSDTEGYVRLSALAALDALLGKGFVVLADEDRATQAHVSLTKIVDLSISSTDSFVKSALFEKLAAWLSANNANEAVLRSTVERVGQEFLSIMDNCEQELYESVLTLQLALLKLGKPSAEWQQKLLFALHVEAFVSEIMESGGASFSQETITKMQQLVSWILDHDNGQGQGQGQGQAAADADAAVGNQHRRLREQLEAWTSASSDNDGHQDTGTTNDIISFFSFEDENLDCGF